MLLLKERSFICRSKLGLNFLRAIHLVGAGQDFELARAIHKSEAVRFGFMALAINKYLEQIPFWSDYRVVGRNTLFRMIKEKPHIADMLAPLTRLSLREGVLYQEFDEYVKQSCIASAIELLQEEGTKVTVSSISLKTGIRRKEVTRIFKRGESKQANVSIPARVVGCWVSDERFRRKSSGGRRLSYDGEGSEFWDLVLSVSSDIHPGIVLRELERSGIVKRTQHGVSLQKQVYAPAGNREAVFEMLARDMSNLAMSVEENLKSPPGEIPNLHGTTFFTNIDPADLPKIREWMVEQGSAFHSKVRKYLSKFHKELDPNSEAYASGITLYLTTFTRAIVPKRWQREKEE